LFSTKNESLIQHRKIAIRSSDAPTGIQMADIFWAPKHVKAIFVENTPK
jgi:hypothetical protein